MTEAPKKKSKLKKILTLIAAYVLANVLIFFINPYSSPWHYESQKPEPVVVERPNDSELSVSKIEKTLNEIDLAYSAREPNSTDKVKKYALQSVAIFFMPSSIALGMKQFMGYLGPANSAQQAFTISVKKRYNHLVGIGKSKGMTKTGFLFSEEPSLEKENGASY